MSNDGFIEEFLREELLRLAEAYYVIGETISKIVKSKEGSSFKCGCDNPKQFYAPSTDMTKSYCLNCYGFME